MPFKLANILDNFQKYLNKIPSKKLNIFIVVYLEDILIYIKEPGQSNI